MSVGDYVDPYAGPPGSDVRPPRRPGPIAWVVAAIVLVATIAFLITNRVEDAPSNDEPTNTTVTTSSP